MLNLSDAMDPPWNMESKVAIVTGGGSGIGQALCVALAGAGCSVCVVSASQASVDETLLQISRVARGGAASTLGLALDVTQEAQMQYMVERTLDRFGRIDVLIASAGLGKKAGSQRTTPHATASLPLDEWNAVIGVNLTGVFLCNRAVLPVLVRQGSGCIINICSSTTPRGLRGTPFAPAYCASKYGVVGFTEALAAEVASLGIRVQAIFPGAVDTPLVKCTNLARPFGGAITADNFAQAVLWLIQQPADTAVVHPHILPFRGAFSQLERSDLPAGYRSSGSGGYAITKRG